MSEHAATVCLCAGLKGESACFWTSRLWLQMIYSLYKPSIKFSWFRCCSYGLLGPSGCGKTTLLKCIVGTLKISRGHITVLGKPPAFPGHDVPGKMVGYMPQVNTTPWNGLQMTCFYARIASFLLFLLLTDPTQQQIHANPRPFT